MILQMILPYFALGAEEPGGRQVGDVQRCGKHRELCTTVHQDDRDGGLHHSQIQFLPPAPTLPPGEHLRGRWPGRRGGVCSRASLVLRGHG